MDELLRTSARLTPKLVSMLLYTATRTIKNNLCKLKKKKCSGKSLHRSIHFLLWLQAFHQSSAAFICLLGFESCPSFNFRSPRLRSAKARREKKKKKKKASGADSTSGSSSKENWSRRLEDLEGCLNVKWQERAASWWDASKPAPSPS